MYSCIMNENGERMYSASVFCVCSLVKFYALNVVIILSDCTPNGECFDIHKSPKDPPNISP